MKLTAQKGFTLIELMIVIVILGILLSIGLANYLAVLDRAHQAQLRSNMAILRITAMTYSMDNSYPPDNYYNLKKEAIAQKYWVKYFNPWTDREDMG
ncbi:MAG: type II secretion system protein, partial [Candidatus Sericytochromatia bacterium]